MEFRNGIVEKIYDTDCAYDEIIIPDRTTVIGDYAAHNINVKKIFFPNSIKELGNFSFLECSNIEEIILPPNVTKIGERCFKGCKNLKSINLPDSIQYIGPSAFSDCERLEEIILPKNIKKINFRTFAGCKRLKKIIIPEGVEEIDWAAFAGCDSLEEIILPNSLKKIDKQLFLNCKNLKRITLPDNITALPDEFFKGCEKLDIELPTRITHLRNSVFENCFRFSHFPSNVIYFGSNCFKNCRGIEKINLNDKTPYLPDGIFDGCCHLSEVSYSKLEPLHIGKKCFRNCSSLKTIPSFVSNYETQAFENCTDLKEVDIISSNIPFACFRGCKNIKKINNTDKILTIQNFAFSGCSSLEEMLLGNISKVPSECFSNCKSLKKVLLGLGVERIGSRSFYNCNNLETINLPDNISYIGKEAFKYCHSIPVIKIPGQLKDFGYEAFSCMDALERIEISPYNKIFITPDNKILIDQMKEKLVLYTSGCKDKSYSLNNYCLETDLFANEIIRPIKYIGSYAFSGNKYLEELTISSCCDELEYTAFKDCFNLKTLNINGIPLFSYHGFKLRDNGQYFINSPKKDLFIPFEKVIYSGDIYGIWNNALAEFRNVKELVIHNCDIGSMAFRDCDIKEISINSEVNNIGNNAFPEGTEITFKNGLRVNDLVSLSHHDDYFGNYKLYEIGDGTYYIEKDGSIVTVTKKQIDEVCSNSQYIHNNPVLFLDFMNDLINHDFVEKYLLDGVLISNMSVNSRNLLFSNIDRNDTYFEEVLTRSRLLEDNDSNLNCLLNDRFNDFLDFVEILRKYKVQDKVLYDKLFMSFSSKDDFENLLSLDRELLLKVINKSKLLEVSENGKDENKIDYDYSTKIISENLLFDFLEDVDTFGIKDPFLMNKIFILNCDNPLLKKLFKVYDANVKRTLINSGIFDDYSSASQNLNDLLNLFEITGALDSDSIKRQRATNFLTEKVFCRNFDNGQVNECQIVGDDLHRIFNFRLIRDEFDSEFAEFFLNNYQSLYKLEKEKSGFIERVYNNFRVISKTCTSNKGVQRKLKVTVDKCVNYLSSTKFDGVTGENRDLADFIGAWYDSNDTWMTAQKILKESLDAPRNIFTRKVNADNEVVFDKSPSCDLRENINSNFSYEWLPKQAKENLLLGKYCSCCAHLAGVGFGIMRASMILDCCQNMVIRNENGDIVSKATIYVNDKDGYAVFNNVETSLNHRTSEELYKIYRAFIRGSQAFVDTYNKNNPDNTIKKVTIGANRNTILKLLEEREEKHPIVDIHEALKYGKYALNKNGYNGDWSTKQRLVLKR